MNNKINIFVASHKPVNLRLPENYIILEVGAELHEGIFGTVKDNEGENISHKNRNFCELTGLYWIWKNSVSNIVGLVHYRRFFSKYRINPDVKYYLTSSQIHNLLKTNDIILPEKIVWKNYTVAEGYDHGSGYLKDLKIIGAIISEKYPDYAEAWNTIIYGHSASYCNMMICFKNTFDAYCNWLFDILFEAEKRIDISEYSIAEARIFGYLSEILLNVWVIKNNFKIAYVPVVNTGIQMRKTIRLLALLEKIPFLQGLVKRGLQFDFNRKQG